MKRILIGLVLLILIGSVVPVSATISNCNFPNYGTVYPGDVLSCNTDGGYITYGYYSDLGSTTMGGTIATVYTNATVPANATVSWVGEGSDVVGARDLVDTQNVVQYWWQIVNSARPAAVTAGIACSPTAPNVDEMVWCADTSTAGETPITSTYIGFGDNGNVYPITSGSGFGHFYSTPNTYTAIIVACDESGACDDAVQSIEVGGGADYNTVTFRLVNMDMQGLSGTIDVVGADYTQTLTTDSLGYVSASFLIGQPDPYAIGHATGYYCTYTSVFSASDSTVTVFMDTVVTPTPATTTTLPVTPFPTSTIPGTPGPTPIPDPPITPVLTATPPTLVPTPAPTATPAPNPVTDPVANFVASGTTGSPLPLTVTLTSTSTGATSYQWWLIDSGQTYNLGEFNTATFQATEYTLDGNGLYFVTLEVWNNINGYSFKQEMVAISPTALPTPGPTPTIVPTATPAPIQGGGMISFDKAQYLSGETANITYSYDALVWQAGKDSAYITIWDNYGVVIPNSEVKLSNTNSAGNITITLTPFDVYTQGTYIAHLETRDLFSVNIRNTTTMIIDNGVVMSGYINGITMQPISGATITMSQPSTSKYNTTTSAADGYWISPNFTAGADYPITLTVSKTGYGTDTSVLTYFSSQTATHVNRTLIPTDITNVTNAVTGIVSSSVGSKAPLPGALVVLTGKLGGVTTNISTSSGAYAFTGLTLNATYSIYSSEVTGYQTSPIKQFVAGDFSTILTLECSDTCWL
jgi:hypothetical protein